MAAKKSLDSMLAELLVDRCDMILLAVDASTQFIVAANLKACRLLGYTRKNMIGMDVNAIESGLSGMFYWQEVVNGNIQELEATESEFQRSDGSSMPVEKTVSKATLGTQHYILISASDITHRLQADDKLEVISARLKSTLESTADGILAVSGNGEIEGMSRRFSKMWDIPANVLSSSNDQKVFSHLFHSVNNPGLLRDFINTVEDGEHATTIRLNSGKIFELRSCPQQATLGRVFSCNDVTVRKQAEEALSKSRESLQRLLDSMSEGAYGLDGNGICTFVNPAFLKMLRFQHTNQVLGKQIHSLIQHSYPDGSLYPVSECKSCQALQTRQNEHDDNEVFWKADGTCIPVEYWTSPIIEDDKATGTITTFIDISERKYVENMKREFISTVSHELRTPLTSISGALGLIEGNVFGKIPEKMQQMITIAYRNCQQLIFLINDLLDMEKLVAGKMSFDICQQALMPLIDQSLESNGTYGSSRRVSLSLVSTVPDVEVNIDGQRLQQVLSNLLSNAIKFSPENGTVEIAVLTQDNMVRVKVTDHGPGIPEEFRGRIFQKFSQADSSDARQKGGTGLGLAITRELVNRMGGQIGFDSVEGQGSCFYFDFPLA